MWWWTLLGCGGAPVDGGCVPEGPHLAIATTDYEVGALATVSLDGSCVGDGWSSLGPDPLVRWLDDRLVVADRSSGDQVRTFAPGDYEAPLTEFAPSRGGNTHDVARDGDRLVVSLYDQDVVLVTDLDGDPIGEIALTALADADGIPEADRLVRVGGELKVALQLLDRADGYRPTGPGLLVGLDLGSLGTAAIDALAPNPKILPDPTDPDALVAASGRFFEADGQALRWTPDGVSVLAEEAELGFDLTHVLPVGDGFVLVGIDLETDGPSHLVCVDAGGARVATTYDGWLVDGVSDGEQVFVASRTSWNGAGAGGVMRVDLDDCSLARLADGFLLDPYGLALVR